MNTNPWHPRNANGHGAAPSRKMKRRCAMTVPLSPCPLPQAGEGVAVTLRVFHVKALLVGLLALALAGCAGHTVTGESPEMRAASAENPRARIHTELGAGYFARGQYAVALQALRTALEADANYPPAHNILGLVHGELREDRQAEAAFRRAIELSPHYSEAHNNYGLFLCQRGRLAEGLARFEAALANPLYATPEKALANAGACALEKGDLDLAERHYVGALKRLPNQASALQGMAEVNFRRDRLLAARAQLRQLVASNQLNAQALWLGIRLERVLGDKAAELSYEAQLRRRFPDSMQAQWLLTGQYDKFGGLL